MVPGVIIDIRAQDVERDPPEQLAQRADRIVETVADHRR